MVRACSRFYSTKSPPLIHCTFELQVKPFQLSGSILYAPHLILFGFYFQCHWTAPFVRHVSGRKVHFLVTLWTMLSVNSCSLEKFLLFLLTLNKTPPFQLLIVGEHHGDLIKNLSSIVFQWPIWNQSWSSCPSATNCWLSFLAPRTFSIAFWDCWQGQKSQFRHHGRGVGGFFYCWIQLCHNL